MNIIKVFYDRLGQMDYPKSQVELSDISSVDNDLDIDHLLSSVKFSARSNEGRDNRGKKVVKKGKDKTEKTGNQKRKAPKGKIGVQSVSPYENNVSKLFKQIPAKKKNKGKTLKPTGSQSAAPGGLGNKQRSATKVEADKTKKKKLASSSIPVAKSNSRKLFLEPIKRVMNLATQLRKTKSSTAAEKRECFTDTRSLTRLHSDYAPTPAVNGNKEQTVSQEKNLEIPSRITEEQKSSEIIELATPKPGIIQKGPNRMVRKEIRVLNRVNDVKLQNGEDSKIPQQDKGTSLSELVIKSINAQIPEVKKMNKIRSITPNANTGSLKLMESAHIKRTDFKGRRSFDVKVPSTNIERRGSEQKPSSIRQVPQPVKLEDMIANVEPKDEPKKNKNGIISHSTHITPNTEVKKRVDMFEMAASKEKETPDIVKAGEKTRPTSKLKGASITRTKSRANDDISRRSVDSFRPTSSANTILTMPALRGAGDYVEKDPVVKTLTISQIKKMKDNLMKFNAIPFIVGQSTSKSYHIGLNIQETYSLFKQTPSMTALMVNKNASSPEYPAIHSRVSQRTARFILS